MPGPHELQHLLEERAFLDISAGVVLTDLYAFLSAVEDHEFSGAFARLLGRESNSMEALHTVAAVAERLSAPLVGDGAALSSKALQEAMLDAGGIQQDGLEDLDLDAGMRQYLNRMDAAGFVELFLSLYVFHSIWMSIHDDAAGGSAFDESFFNLMQEVRRLARDAVAAVIRESIEDRELERARTQPRAGIRILERVRRRVLMEASDGPKAGASRFGP